MSNFENVQMKSMTFLLGMTLLAGSLASCGQSQTPEGLVEQAKQSQIKGDDKAAVIQLKNALQKDPNEATARYLLGVIYNESGDPQSAEKELRQALKLGVEPVKVLPDIAKALLAQGKFQAVLDETNAIAGEQEAPEISSARGNAYLALGERQKAKESFERALKNKPGFPAALVGLARYSLTERNIEASEQYSQEAVEKNPQDIEAMLYKADLLRAQGKIEQALDAYDEVLKLKPNHAVARLSKAFMEIGQGKYDAAQADIDAARKDLPQALMVYYTQALLDFQRGKLPQSLESLQKILGSAPDHMPSVLLAAAVQYSLGSMPQAESHLKKFLEVNPDNLYARKLMIATLLKSRQTQRALDRLGPLLKEQGADEDASILALAGEAYMQAQDYSKATEYFEKVSNLTPQNAGVHSALAMSSMAQGNQARAIGELEMAAKLDTQSTQPDVLLILNYLRSKEYDKAMDVANKLEKEQPTNPLAYNLKGGVFLAKDDFVNARANFEKALSHQPSYYPAVSNLVRLDVRDKNPAAAKKRLENFLAKNGDNLTAKLALAQLAISQKQYKEAEASLQKTMQEHPESYQPGYMLVKQYMAAGEKNKALELAVKLQASNTESSELLLLQAETQSANGNDQKALEAYQRLATLKPQSALVQYRIASVNIALKNKQAAADAYSKALALNPNYLEPKMALAMLEASNGNHDKALAMARDIQQLHAQSPVGYVLEGDLQMENNKYAQAAKAYEKGLSIGKNGALLVKIYAALSRDGRSKEAESRLLQWLQDHPEDNAVRAMLADSYQKNKQDKLAIEQYELVLKRQPANVLALNNLAAIYQRVNDPRALDLAEQAYKQKPDNAAILDTLGWILVEKGSLDRGMPLLEKAVGLAPESTEIRYHYCVGLVKAGDKPKARKELEKLVSLGNTFPQYEEAKALLKQL